MRSLKNFLEWVGKNGDAVIDFIRKKFEAERNIFSESLREARVIDTAATLMLTARILYDYGSIIGAVDAGSGDPTLKNWRQAILQAVLASEDTSRTQNPVCMYLQAFFDMLDRREIMIATDIERYEAGKHIGYAAGDMLWIWHKAVYSRVCKYWQKLGIIFPLTCEKVNEHLENASIIKAHFEGGKRLYVHKSALPQRSRLLVLSESQARNYLEMEM